MGARLKIGRRGGTMVVAYTVGAGLAPLLVPTGAAAGVTAAECRPPMVGVVNTGGRLAEAAAKVA